MKKIVAAREGRDDAAIKHAVIDYQPVSRYRPFWPDMEAFAVPSFYDGRVRVNLMGRERYGSVSPNRHHHVIEEIKTTLNECSAPGTGEPVVAEFHEPVRPPLERGPTESDLYVYWRGLFSGIVHPSLGTIGPIPFRRTGGHSGPNGFLYCAGDGIGGGPRGRASSFDVLPTIAAMLGEKIDTLDVSGRPVPELVRDGAIPNAA